jgi:hypothetical protein
VIARIDTYLPAAAEKVWRTLLRRDTFLHITHGMLGFRGSESWPEVFREGTVIHTRLLFFHVIPGWKHALRVVRVDRDTFTLLSEESGGIVKAWNHRIRLEPQSHDRCRYTDEIDIEAGLFTPLIWVWAHIFYRYRQHRWRRLARDL